MHFVSLQDLKAFSGDSFDAREWVNQTFKSADAQKQNKEVATTQRAKTRKETILVDFSFLLSNTRRRW